MGTGSREGHGDSGPGVVAWAHLSVGDRAVPRGPVALAGPALCCSPSLHIRWTVPLLLQWEGSKFTRNFGSNLATSPWSTLGMLCRSSSSNLRFRAHAAGALGRRCGDHWARLGGMAHRPLLQG